MNIRLAYLKIMLRLKRICILLFSEYKIPCHAVHQFALNFSCILIGRVGCRHWRRGTAATPRRHAAAATLHAGGGLRQPVRRRPQRTVRTNQPGRGHHWQLVLLHIYIFFKYLFTELVVKVLA